MPGSLPADGRSIIGSPDAGSVLYAEGMGMTAAQSVTLTELEDGAAFRGVSLHTDYLPNGDLIVVGFEDPYRVTPDGELVKVTP